MDVVGAFVVLIVEGVEVEGPATLAQSWVLWMCVPSPTLFADTGPSSWPGRTMLEGITMNLRSSAVMHGCCVQMKICVRRLHASEV